MSDQAEQKEQKNTTAFCEEHQITAKCSYLGRRVEELDEDKTWEFDEWSVQLTCRSPKKVLPSRMTTAFRMGTGHEGKEPGADDVLDSLISDSDVENYEFEEWADNLGYSTDSRKAERIYKACQKNTKKLRKFLGDDLLETVQTDYERL